MKTLAHLSSFASLALLLALPTGCGSGPVAPPPSDTIPPTAPANLTATAVSSAQINLSWTASTDNVGVTRYLVHRCQGSGCSNFAQIASATSTSFNDTGLTPLTSYAYKIRATDAAANLSDYSNAASATTLAPSNVTISISPSRAAVTASESVQFTATVTGTPTTTVNWFVDGTMNGNSTVGTVVNGFYQPGSAIGTTHTISAQSTVDGTSSNFVSVAVTDLAGYFSWRGTGSDIGRQGVNAKEYALAPTTLSSSTFGKLFSCPLDGFAFAQPLYVANLTIASAKHNVVYVATANDSIYAFDADDPSCKAVWFSAKVSLLAPGEAAANASDVNEGGMGPIVGITGTPVIDVSTNTLYAVALSENASHSFFQRLHAIDITTGNEKAGSPILIAASVPGTGSGSTAGLISFDPKMNNQRPSLLLSNGVVYIAWGSHGDVAPYHGWVVAYRASSLVKLAQFSTTPDGSFNGGQEGGIWMSGAAPSADAVGNVYLSVGNGTFDANSTVAPGHDFGDTVLKLTLNGSSLSPSDYFAPFGQMVLNQGDTDLGSTGVVLLPDLPSGAHPHLMFCGGKDGRIYLLDRDNLGGFSGSTNNIVQFFQLSGDAINGFRSTPAFFNNTLYGAGFGDPLMAVTFTTGSGLFNTTPSFRSAELYGGFGTSPMISAQGTSNGIVWALAYGPDQSSPSTAAILRAYDAANLNKLYDSSQQGARDQTGVAVKFTVPTVANGKVYVGTQTELDVFGLLSN